MDTNTTKQRISQLMQDLGATQTPEEFISTVSNVYHHHESTIYDNQHQEIFGDDTGRYWQQALEVVATGLKNPALVLDVGCGTGYASEQALAGLSVDRLICSDLSWHMVAQCRKKFSQRYSERIDYICGEVSTLQGLHSQCDVVITNSVLHHILDPTAFLQSIANIIRPGGYYMMGHEPSALFFKDVSILRWSQWYHRSKRWSRLLSPQWWQNKLGTSNHTAAPSLLNKVNHDLMQQNIIQKPLSGNVLQKLVDIHVPLTINDMDWGYPGFEAQQIVSDFLPDFEVVYQVSYHHIHNRQDTPLEFLWQPIEQYLERTKPNAGANILVVFQKKA